MIKLSRIAGACALATVSLSAHAFSTPVTPPGISGGMSGAFGMFPTVIDFSDRDHFKDARGEPEYTTTVDNFTVTLKAWVDTGQYTPNPVHGIDFNRLVHDSYYLDLTWDTNDGIGMNIRDKGAWKHKYRNYENDEIEGDEVLELRFDSPVFLHTITVDDLFYEKRGGERYQEMGFYQIDQGGPVKFQAPADRKKDEVVTIEVNAVVNGSVWFWAPGKLGDHERHEFALQSVAVSPAPVPVPAALWLFGSGLAGLIGMARRRG